MTIRKTLILAVAIALSLACLLLAPTSAVAQNLQEGAVRGTVFDTSHAIVPTAKLTLTNPSTGIRREQTVTGEGVYSFDNVPPGEYTLVAVADGFAETTVKGISVSVG